MQSRPPARRTLLSRPWFAPVMFLASSGEVVVYFVGHRHAGGELIIAALGFLLGIRSLIVRFSGSR